MSFTSVTIISPEAANGRNVVALGVTKALAAAGKTGVFRPAVCRKDTFTDVLIEASNAGLSREQSVGVCPKRARNDKEGSRADIVAAYTQAVETARPDAMVIVGTDRSAVNDPAMFSFNADFAADLQSPVLLAVCTIERTPEQVKSTVEASTKVIEDAGSKVVGVFITGCDDTQPDPLKACFVDYPVPVWTLPAVDFNDDDAISKADEAFATNVDAAELTAVLESPFDAPTTPYAFQYGLLGKAKADKKTIVLDNYARWRISDPLQFYRTMRTIPGAQARLDDVVYSQLRALVGAYTLTEVVSKERATIMTRVTEKVSDLMKPYGVEVLDVRIKRTDLPTENQRSIFDRMRAERERQAKQYRSEGQEEATRIRSDADRQKALILAEANREAQVLYGQGDAQAAAVYAAAYGKSPEFYSYQRWLDALRKSFKENSKMVLGSRVPLLDLQK